MNGNLFPSSDGRYLVVWHTSDDNAVVDSPSSDNVMNLSKMMI